MRMLINNISLYNKKLLYIHISNIKNECIAQQAEHLTFNQGVSGSNPDTFTLFIKNKHFIIMGR